jgi:hypothetical protein
MYEYLCIFCSLKLHIILSQHDETHAICMNYSGAPPENCLKKREEKRVLGWSMIFSSKRSVTDIQFGWFFEGELEVTLAELEESNCNLASLKAQRDAAKGAFFPVLNVGNKPVASDKVRDKQKDLNDMESTLKELKVIC